MSPNLLILGGTQEATALGQRLADLGVEATVSLAGRVARPRRQPLPVRVGGFGGAGGLARHIESRGVSHVIDATHPFAAQMSANAAMACAQTGTPLLAFTRPPWQAQCGDRWQPVPDIPSAAAALTAHTPVRVMLAIGRMHLAAFSCAPQHHYILRLVDPPQTPMPLPETTILVERGPFSERDDRALMQRHGVELVVSKNAGGGGAVSKITAARRLGLPVIMINRPPAPPAREEVYCLESALDWLTAHGVILGV